jgi:uncharacterized protein
MSDFVGRERELGLLNDRLEEIRRSGRGAFIALRGRRRVGKSRLVEEFARRSRCPCIYYTAIHERREREVERFVEAVAQSTAPAARMAQSGLGVQSWEGALELAVNGASRARPLILVIDELPYLVEDDPAIEATLQLVWDRIIQSAPVLFILIGSDRAVMESLSHEGRPLYDRPREMVVRPLTPADIATMLRLSPADALDAYLITGGFPILALEWGRGRGLDDYLARALTDPTSSLLVSAERALAAEFPDRAQARTVLRAIGADARVNREIATRAGLSGTSLHDALAILLDKGMVERCVPYSAVAHPKNARYLVADPYLRFWLRFIDRAGIDLVERGRGPLLIDRLRESWLPYRGRAIEPVIRGAVERLLPDARFGPALHVGGFWTRTNSIEVDLVGGDTTPTASTIGFVGSIKWRSSERFKRSDASALAALRASVPGAGDAAVLLGVSRSGFDPRVPLDVRLGPREIVTAYGSSGRGRDYGIGR